LTLGRWTKITAKRYHRDGLLEVEGSGRATGSSPGSLRTLNVGESLWIGGVDTGAASRASDRAQAEGGFVGCARAFQAGTRAVSLAAADEDPAVKVSKRVVDCEENPCSRLPCQNSGACSADGQGFKCRCGEGFAGRRCHRRRDQCHPNPCKNRGRCSTVGGGFSCQCEAGFGGRMCEEKSGGPSWDRYRKR